MLLDMGWGALGIWNWYDAFACRLQILCQVQGKCAKVADGCWIILQNEQLVSAWSPGGQYLGHFVGSVSWEAKTKDPQGGKAVDGRKVFPALPNRSACQPGLLTQAASPHISSVIKISLFPIWDITILIYLPPLLTASYFLDDSEVRAAAGDQYSLFLNWIAEVLPFHLYLSPSLITPWDCFMQTPSDGGMCKTQPFLHGLECGSPALKMARYVGRTDILNLLLRMAKDPQELLF